MADKLVRPTSASWNQSSPRFQNVTPSNSADLQYVSREIWVRGAGDLVVEMDDGSRTQLTFTAVAGDKIPIAVHKVRATGTTATGIIAFF